MTVDPRICVNNISINTSTVAIPGKLHLQFSVPNWVYYYYFTDIDNDKLSVFIHFIYMSLRQGQQLLHTYVRLRVDTPTCLIAVYACTPIYQQTLLIASIVVYTIFESIQLQFSVRMQLESATHPML